METEDAKKKRHRKHAVAVAIFGAILALACRALPPEYHGPCETVIKICTGSF